MYNSQKIDSHHPIECYRCGHYVVVIEEYHKEEFPGAMDQVCTHFCPNCGYRGELVIYEGMPTLIHPMQP